MSTCALVGKRWWSKSYAKCTAGETRKNCSIVGDGTYSKQKVASDSVGVCDIRIKNAVTGSRYRIEIASDGTLVAEGSVASQDFNVSVSYYPPGNSNNNMKVKIRKGTAAPKYQPFETQVEAVAAGALAYIAQVPDPIA